MTKQISIARIVLLGLFSSGLSTTGCKNGLVVEELPLSSSDVINYGVKVTNNETPIEAKIYGQLMPGGSGERSEIVLAGEQRDISQCVLRLRHLPSDYAFSSAQEGYFNTWVDNFHTKFSSLALAMSQARGSATAAQSLASYLEPELTTSGLLKTRISEGRGYVPESARSEFDRIANDCVRGYQRVYQIALVLPQSLVQDDCVKQLSKVEIALSNLANNANTKLVISNVSALNSALNAVTDAAAKAKGVRAFVDGITQRVKVAAKLSNAIMELQNALTTVNNDYVNRADATMKPEAGALTREAISAANALATIATNYSAGIENLKDTKTDAELRALSEQAFSGGISVVLGDFTLDSETDVNALARLLGASPVVVLKQDASSELLTSALASAVVYNVAQNFGLPDVDNVVGPANNSIIKAKSEFSMNNDEFKRYAQSRAELIRRDQSKDGNYKNVYVIFADPLMTEGADVSAMIDEFVSDKGKVLVIASDTTPYQGKGKLFQSGNLDMIAGILTGAAVLQEMKLPVPAQEVSEKVVRIALGLRNSFTLADISPLMKETALRLQSLTNPTSSDVDSKIIGTMADHKVPSYLVTNSKILSDGLRVVRGNLARDRYFYVQQGSGRDPSNQANEILRNQSIRDAAARAAASQHEIQRTEDARREHGSLIARANETIRRVKDSSRAFDATERSGDALSIVRLGIDDVNEHLDAIKAIATDRACSGILMKVNKNVSPVLNPIPPASLAPSHQYYFRRAGNFIYPGDPVQKARFEQIGPYALKMVDAVKARQEISHALANTNNNATNELPYASINCFAKDNITARIRSTSTTIKRSLADFEGAIRRVSNGNVRGDDKSQIARIVDELKLAQGGLKDSVRAEIEDFSPWDSFLNTDFSNTPNFFGLLARTAGAPNDQYRQVNRRLYAYLFSMIVGKIQHASIPFNADGELYHGFVDNDVMLKKMTDAVGPMDLAERLARTLLLKEVANVVEIYRDIIGSIYSLSHDDRDAFINNATANDFLAFFNKLKTIIDDRTYLPIVQDLTQAQTAVRNEVMAKVLPDEVMTMLNVYPAWHPHAYFRGALGMAFQSQWGVEAVGGVAIAQALLRVDVQNAYAALAGFAATNDFLKDRAIGEYESLKALAIAQGVNNPVVAGPLGFNPAIAALAPPLGYPPAAPAGLKAVRFVAASVGNVQLAAESDGVKKLVPIWNDLLSLMQRVYESADKIYFYLTLIKKS